MPVSILASSMAAPNIALIKYWGKRDDLLKLAINDSVSITLDSSVLASRTTVLLGGQLKRDIFVLNGKRVEDAHIAEAIQLIRARLGRRYPAIRKPMLVISSNNFPTAAGIASSASGFAALAQALAGAMGIEDKREISILARLGSGSASRSVYGGFARWKAGKKKDGNDSYAVPVAPASHWPSLVDLIVITDPARKKVSSKAGMERTMRTSDLCHCRLATVGKRVEAVSRAIRARDLQTMALFTMRDSNAMHATMLDTWPPVLYMNDISRAIVEDVQAYNDAAGQIRAAYTFDAGPNAHIITTKKDALALKRRLAKIKGVRGFILSPPGPGSHLLRPDEKLVQDTARRLKIKLD